MANIPTGKLAGKGRSAEASRPATQATGNVGASLGSTASGMPSHEQLLTVTELGNAATIVPMTPQQIAAHQAPTAPVIDPPSPSAQMLTVTPLPANATVRLMRPWEISAFAPPRPVRPEALVIGPMTSSESNNTCTVSVTVKGVPLDNPYVGAVVDCLKHHTGINNRVSHFAAKPTTDGCVEISFRSWTPFLVCLHERCCRDVGTLFKNLLELGVSAQDFRSLSSDDYIVAHLSSADWHCERSEHAVRPRGELVRLFLIAGYFDLAFPLLCDLAETCRETGSGDLLDTRSRKILTPEALRLVRNTDPITPKIFTQLVCNSFKDNPQFLKHRHCLVQAGRMLLRSISDPEFQSDVHSSLREKIFVAIGEFRRRCSKEEAEVLLQELLDLPADDRGELLLDPRAQRLLLIAFPTLVEVFEKIEANAYEVFLERMKTLEDCGIVFSGTIDPLEPVQIDATHVDSSTVDALLDLGEAAVMCAGRINWSTGVLQFLS